MQHDVEKQTQVKNTHHQPKYIKIEKIPLPPFQFSFFLFSFPRRPPSTSMPQYSTSFRNVSRYTLDCTHFCV